MVSMGKVMTLDELAAYLRVHPSTVYRFLKQRKLPAFKVGSEWRFNRETIDAWLYQPEQRRVPRRGD